MITQDNITLQQRIAAPMPKFFKVLLKVGLTLGTVGGIIAAAPIALPAVIVTIGGYMATAGVVAAAVSGTTVDFSKVNQQQQQ